MKKQLSVLLPLLIFSIGLIFVFRSKENPSDSEIKITESRMQAETERVPRRQLSSDGISQEEIEDFRSKLVRTDEVMKEVQTDPHGAPRSIIQFAESLGNLMEQGLKNESDANLLMEELHECAVNETADITVRALCVSNAEKLTKPFPQLKDESDDIRNLVPREVRNLADARKLTPQKSK